MIQASQYHPSQISQHLGQLTTSYYFPQKEFLEALKKSEETNDPNRSFSCDFGRSPDAPVGLRNIGNVCYFNSLAHILFNLEPFMQIILNINTPKDFDKLVFQLRFQSPLEEKLKKKSFELIISLQRLFIFMKHGNKKVLSPKAAIDSILDNEGNLIEVGEEKDLGEFSLIFFTRLVEGLCLSRDLDKLMKKNTKRQDSLFEELFFGEFNEATINSKGEVKRSENFS